jgi:hypothetical protein
MDVDCSTRDSSFFTDKWRSPSKVQLVQKDKTPDCEVKIRRRKKKPSIFIALFTDPFYIARNCYFSQKNENAWIYSS